MQTSQYLVWLTSLTLSGVAMAGFDAKIKNNNQASVPVRSHMTDKSKYARSDAANTGIEFQFKGGCPSGERLKKFQLRLGGQVTDIPVSGNNRHISGNNGAAWATHSLPGFLIQADNPALIKACNDQVTHRQNQGYALEDILAQDFSLDNSETGLNLEIKASCDKKVGFDSPPMVWTAVDSLKVKALCKKTGYVVPVNVSHVQLAIDKTVSLGGLCNVNLKGALQTSQPNQTVRFRYEHIDKNFNKTLSSIHQVKTDLQGYVNFSHSYDVANGPGKEQGKIRIIGVSHDFQSQQKNYSMDCNDGAAGSLQQATPSTIDLSVTPVESSKKAYSNQLCPTQVEIVGTIKAGSSFSGQTVFVGQSLADITTQPFSVNKGQTKTVTRIRALNWSSPASSTLTLNNSTAAPKLMEQQLMQGLNIVGQNSQDMILSYPRKPFVIRCSLPKVNPALQQPGGLTTLPNHTGGGQINDLQLTPSQQTAPSASPSKTK